jgi:hypothetical protein
MSDRGNQRTASPPKADTAEPSATYSSPPCFMHELDDVALGYIGRDELLALLNELLEAERAGAKVVGRLSIAAPDPAMATLLRGIAHDEGVFCAMLGRHIAQLGGTPSNVTGAFHDKVMALADLQARLDLLNRGQGWVVRKLRDVLPRIRDDVLRQELRDMLVVHERNIQACTDLPVQT